MCFACGRDNPVGLGMSFEPDGEEMLGRFTPGQVHQGFPGLLHGGIMATLLDETMAHWLGERGIVGTTARLEVRYRAGAPLGREITCRARAVRRRRDFCELTAEATEGGRVLAEARAVFACRHRGKEVLEP